MKLRLPLVLASILLASFTRTSMAESYTWTGGNNSGDVHQVANWDPSFASWQATWSGGAVNKIILSKEDTAYKVLDASFSTMSISGITVTATGYSLIAGGSYDRPFDLNAAAGESIIFDIQEDFNFGQASGRQWNIVNVNADFDMNVSSGKTLYFYGNLSATSERTLTINGGGSVRLMKVLETGFAGNWVIDGNSSLVAAMSADTNFLGTGSAIVNAGSSLIVDTINTITISSAVTGTGGIEVLQGRLNMTYANSAFAGTFTVHSGATLSIGGDGSLGSGSTVVMKGGSTLNSTSSTTINNVSVTLDGGVVTINNGSYSAFGAAVEITGTGGLLKAGSQKFDIRNAAGHTFAGDVQVEGGTLFWGWGTSTGGNTGDTFGLGTGTVYVKDGATFTLHLHTAGGTNYKTITNTISLSKGATLHQEDGSYRLAHLDIQTGSGEETFISTKWAKHLAIDKLTGSGHLVIQGRTGDGVGSDCGIFLNDSNSTFAGILELRGRSGDVRQQRIELTTEKAAIGATIKLDSSSAGDLRLRIAVANAEIAGLEGVGDNNSILAAATGNTLTVNGGGSFNGKLGAGLKLVKKGVATLTITGTSGDFNGELVAQEGVLNVAGATFTATGGKFCLDGGTLEGVNLKTGQTLYTTGAASSLAKNLSIDGGTVYFSGATTAAISVEGAMTWGAGGIKLKFDDSLTRNVSHTLFTLDTALSDTYLSGLIVNSTWYDLEGIMLDDSRLSTSLTVSSDKKSVLFQLSGSPADLAWNNTGNGSWSLATTGTQYWLGSGAGGLDNYFYNNDNVIFGEVASGSDHVISIENIVFPGSITVNAASQNYEFVSGGSGKISGAGKLVKSGEGKLTISLANDYSGGTEINGGTLHATVVGAMGAGVVTLNGGTLSFDDGVLNALTNNVVVNSGTLKWEGVNTNDISGKISITNGPGTKVTFDIGSNDVTFASAKAATDVEYTKKGTGTLTLTQLGALRGKLIIDEGMVVLSNNSSSGVIYGTIEVNEGGTLYTQRDAFGWGTSANRVSALVLNKGTWTQDDYSGTPNNTMTNITLTMNEGVINGTGRIDFFGTTSSLIAKAGTYNVIECNEVSVRQTNTNFDIETGATLLLSSSIMWKDTANPMLTKLGDGLLILAKSNDIRGGVTVEAGTLELGHNSALGTAGSGNTWKAGTTLSLQNGITISGAKDIIFDSGVVNVLVTTGTATLDSGQGVSGDGGMKKTGAGQLILNGAKAFTGAVELAGGRVSLNNAAGLGVNTSVSVTDSVILDSTADLAYDFSITSGKTFTLNGGDSSGSNTSSAVKFNGEISFNTGGSLILNNGQATIASGQTETGDKLVIKNNSALEVYGSLTLTNAAGGRDYLSIGGGNSSGTKDTVMNIHDGGAFTAMNTALQLGSWMDRGTINIKTGGEANLKGIILEGFGGKLNVEGGELNLGDDGILVHNRSEAECTLVFSSGAINFTETASYSLSSTVTGDEVGYFTLTGADSDGRIISVASGKTATISGVINGDQGFSKTGAGILVLAANNTYTGETILKEGQLTATVAYTNAAKFVLDSTVAGTLLNVAKLSAGQSITAASTNTGAGVSALVVDGGILKYTSASTGFEGFTSIDIDSLTIGADKVIFAFESAHPAETGTYELVNLQSTVLSGTYIDAGYLKEEYYSLQGISTSGTRYTTKVSVSNSDKTLSLAIDGLAGVLDWNTDGGGTWELHDDVEITQYWLLKNSAAKGNFYFNGDTVNFVDVPGSIESSHAINISGSVEPNALNVSANDVEYVFAGTGKIVGSTSLVKTGTGVLKINTSNEYTGGTVISGGEVIVNSLSGLGVGAVTLSGGTLTFAANTLDSVSGINVSSGTLKWASGTTQDISGRITAGASSSLTFDTNGNDVSFATALTISGVEYTKTGDGTLTLGVTGALRGTLTIDGGTVYLNGGGGQGRVHGDITIEDGGELKTNGDALGYDGGATSVTNVTINEGGKWTILGANCTLNTDSNVSLKGGVIEGAGSLDMYGGGSSITASGATNSTIDAPVRLRQADTVITVEDGSTLTINGVVTFSDYMVTAHNLTKEGEGTLVLTGDNDYGSHASATGNTNINEGTLQVGAGGSTGTLGAGTATVASGAILHFDRADSYDIANILAGSGTIKFDGGGSYTLSGVNTVSSSDGVTANMDILDGTVLLNNASALGDNSVVAIRDGSTLDYNSIVAAGTVTLLAEGGSILNNVNGASHNLTVQSGVVTGAGGLVMGSLTMGDNTSRINLAGGDINVGNGGQFVIDNNNEYLGSGDALVQSTGAVTVSGTFKLNISSNLGAGEHVYYLFGGDGTYSAIDATLVFANGKEYLSSFYFLDTTDFATTGQVIINRSANLGVFVNNDDVAALTTHTPGVDEYLGAKQHTDTTQVVLADKTNPVVFDKSYDVGTHGAYKLTNGLGWLDMQTQMTGDNKLLIDAYPSEELIAQGITPLNPEDHGVIISNNNNNYTGETHILDTQVLLDTSSNTAITGGDINLLGTGDVYIGGDNALLELSPGGAGDTGDYTMANNITLVDGATLAQTSGGTELSATIRVASSTASIQNATSQDLIFTGSLVTENNGVMVLKGANSAAATDGNFLLDGATGDIETLQLTDQAHFLLDGGSDASVASLKMTSGTDVNIAGDSTLHLAAVSGVADSRLILAGGTLHATGNLTLNGTGNVTLRVLNPGISLFALSAYNTIEVDSGSTVTLNGLAAADGDFTKTGQGTLVLASDFTPYTGTITIGQGPATLTASTYGGNLTVGVDGTPAELNVNPIVTINGLLTTNAGATTNVGSGSTLAGGLILAGGTYTGGSDITIQGTTLQIGEGSTATFGRDTIIRSNIAELAIGPNATVSFGRGSIIAGTITNGITLETGSTYSGTLNIRANEMTLKSGSTFLIKQEDLNLYSAGNIGLTGTGTINVEQGVTFLLDNGLDFSNAPLSPGGVLTLIETTGTLTIGGANVVSNQDYSEYLGENDYAWYSFSLLGGNKQLNLEIRQDVRFQDYAQTANEWAMAPIANGLAINSNSLDGELQELGKALAMSTTGNARTNLSQLALSTSGIASGYVAQMEGMRRHAFELLNRAVQEKTGVDRLNYEQHHSSIWVNGLGGSYKLKGDGNAIGNTTNVWGGTLGASTSVGENAVVGLSFTYTNSDTRLDRNMGKAEADTYYLDLFTRYRKDNWNIVGVLTGGMYSMDMERNLGITGFGSTSTASPDGKQLMAMLQVGYEFTVSDDQSSILEPFAIVTGGYSEIDGYTESGAGTAGLMVDSQSQALCSAGVGLRFAREYFADRDIITKGRFEVRAIILQDIKEVEADVDAHFIGAPNNRFHIEGMSPGNTAIIIGMGITHPLSQSLSLFANIDGEFRSDADGVGGTVGLKYSF